MMNERKILVIDDDEELCQSLQEQLAITGEFDVVTAGTAAKGITLIKNEPPGLVVLDVGLPDMDAVGGCDHRSPNILSTEPSVGVAVHYAAQNVQCAGFAMQESYREQRINLDGYRHRRRRGVAGGSHPPRHRLRDHR